MPPPRRRPATPPARRPKVAGLHRRTDQQEQPEQEEATPALDVPVIGEETPPAEQPTPRERRRAARGQEPDEEPTPRERRRAVRGQDPVPEEEPVSTVTLASGTISEPETDEDVRQEPEEPASPGPLNLVIPAVLVVVALLLGGLGFFFMQKLSDARIGAGNEVLSDANTTKDVVGAANTAVVSVLSYKFDDMAGATARAKEYLAGEAIDQYDKSMKALETEIQTQKLQVVVNPVSVGVVSLTGDEARVLVFADQIGTRADKQPSGGPTQFAMNMQRVDGKWKIVKLDFFETPK